MPVVITQPNQATPEWLTEALSQNGGLPRGNVVSVQMTSEASHTATIARLALEYSPDAPPDSPNRLFLKLSRPSSQQRVVGDAQRRREVTFHTEIAGAMAHPPIVRCHWAAYCEETRAALLLFDDVSETHLSVGATQAPAVWQAESAMDAFAEVHAFWWDHPGLGETDTLPSQASVTEDVANLRSHWSQFCPLIEDRLTASQRRTYTAVLEQLPRLWQRLLMASGLTLIHGDAHMSNVLLPRSSGAARALIIDWQLWGISFGAMDLSHLMALGWDKEPREAMEEHLMRRYHRGLIQGGVEGYTWPDCWYDYRLAVLLRVLFMPMWFWNAEAPEAVWQGCLVRGLQAAEDLRCAELVDG